MCNTSLPSPSGQLGMDGGRGRAPSPVGTPVRPVVWRCQSAKFCRVFWNGCSQTGTLDLIRSWLFRAERILHLSGDELLNRFQGDVGLFRYGQHDIQGFLCIPNCQEAHEDILVGFSVYGNICDDIF